MSGGSQTATSATDFSSESGPWGPQVPYIKSGFQQAKNLYEQGVPNYYTGESIAGFDPLQNYAQQAVIDYTRGPRAAGMQAGAEGSLMQGLTGQVDTDAYNPMVNAYTQNVIGNLQSEILPQIRQQQVMYQPGGSSRGALEQNNAVTEAVQAGLTDPLAQMYTNAYNQAQNRAVSSGQLYPSIMSAPLNMYGAVGDIGAERRAMSQAAIDADMARYAYEANAPQNALQNYMSMITGNYGGTSSGSSETTKVTPGPSGLSQIGQAAGIIGSLATLSDARIKENIVPEGAKWKGLNVYSYNYIGDSTPRRGVMAQEVEGIYPDAVGEMYGIKYVNYGEI